MTISVIRNKIREKFIKRIPKDDFIKRLRSLVIGDGMLDEGNIYLIDYAIRRMPEEGVVLEIGSYGGLSTNLITYLLEKYKRKEKLINCDPWIYEGYNDTTGINSKMIDGRENISRVEYSKYMKSAFINSVKFLNKNRLPFTYELTSDDFFDRYAKQLLAVDIFGKELKLGQHISFVYIDGNHSFSQVKRDFENTDRYLKKSGLILFDDSKDSLNFGSATFMKEMQANPSYKLICKNPNYLFEKI